MYTSDYLTIGNRLAEYRNYLGWTQAEAAEASHLSERHYSRIENGKSQMRLTTLITICNGLHIPIEELLMDGEQQPECDAKIQEYIDGSSTVDLKKLSRYIHYHLWFHKKN